LKHADDQLHSAQESLVDFNRSGMPLMEVVTEPDLRSAEEARDYAMALRQVLRYLGASEADMEKGQLRAEANVSVRPRGSSELGVKTELKNINSFRALHRAIEHEITRQSSLVESGKEVVQETRGWSEARQETFSQRSKEYAQDYRYFPEPDLPPLRLGRVWIETLRAQLPELPAPRRTRLQSLHGLSDQAVRLLTEERAVADYFEATVAAGAPAKQAANWIAESHERVEAAWLAGVIRMVGEGTINREQGRSVLAEAAGSGRDPATIVQDQGLAQVSDESELTRVIDQVISENPKPVTDYQAGKQEAIGELLREVRRHTGGSANMKLASDLLRRRLAT
jgi:aspartyl-tRNA(Asn)/glutamyl-tRNA(Gln) amidotransferase subunit B